MEVYSYKFTKKVEKFLNKQDKKFLKLFFDKLEILILNPFDNDLDVVPLHWFENNFRLRIWKYRFLYKIENNELRIYFYKWWSRGDVYK